MSAIHKPPKADATKPSRRKAPHDGCDPATSSGRSIRIGFLHLASKAQERSGIKRYGRRLARAMAGTPGVEVVEVEVTLERSERTNVRLIRRAADALGDADLAHIQYSPHLWADNHQRRALVRLCVFLLRFRGPIVCSLHDVVAWSGPYAQRRPDRSRPWQELRRLSPRYLLRYMTHQVLLRLTSCRFVCTAWEARHCAAPDGPKLAVIPHYVDTDMVLPDKVVARRRLGIPDDVKVVTLQGFIVRRKGHDLLVEAIPLVRTDCLFVFAGAPASAAQEQWLSGLLDRAEVLGAGERLRVTGYLTDEAMADYLAATDLAVCPFRAMSASGSLSTWIAAEKPVLTSRLPQIDEYNRVVENAIVTVAPNSPTDLAASIDRFFANAQESRTKGVGKLKTLLSLSTIAHLHLDRMRSLCRARKTVQ